MPKRICGFAVVIQSREKANVMKETSAKQKLTAAQRTALLKTLQLRFEGNMHRHPKLKWSDVENRLESRGAGLWSLFRMEETGGEPDVLMSDKKTGELTWIDCSPESPADRRSLCYDRAGFEARKEHRPTNTAIDLAESMGIELLTEEDYRVLQLTGEFDLKTSSWLQTPVSIRSLGGALFGDRRYNHVFVYHNGAQSYYAARGFRGKIRI